MIDEILDYFDYQGQVKRVFVNDNIEKNILKAFNNIIDNNTQKSVSDSSYARQMADKSFGINHSRLATFRLNRSGLSIGRVQTSTLGLVVQRDEAIANHKREKFYELTLSTSLQNTINTYHNIIFKF